MLTAGSSLVTAVAQVLRTKLVAVSLGPAGIGLVGLFSSMTAFVGTVTDLGLPIGAVRRIAEAEGAGEHIEVARTISATRRIVVQLGVMGALLLAVFSVPVSRITFGTTDYATQVALLSVAIAATAIADGQVAIFQGLRRVGDTAKVAVLTAALALLLTVPVVYFGRQNAIVPLLVSAAGASLAASWWYCRRIQIANVATSWRGAWRESTPLLGLGIAAMLSALIGTGIAYAVRVVIVRYLGVVDAGIYQASTALSGVYCGFILSSMATDFFPRVSAAADDRECNRMVNEQAEVGVLLALPGICATLAFAPLVVSLLYSEQFAPATDVLRWQILGIFLRVASWPLGYLVLAKGNPRLYFWTETSYHLVHAGLIWLAVQLWGVIGAGVAFLGLYMYYLALMSWVLRRCTGFTWSMRNRRIAMVAVPMVASIFLCPMLLPSPWQLVAATAATALASIYALRMLLALPGFRQHLGSTISWLHQLRAAGSRVAGVSQRRPSSGTWTSRYPCRHSSARWRLLRG